jgi:hypothetical protein
MLPKIYRGKHSWFPSTRCTTQLSSIGEPSNCAALVLGPVGDEFSMRAGRTY